MFGIWVASLATLAIIAATLIPQRETAGLGGFWCIVCGDLGTIDVLLNVLLFAPLGFGLVLAGATRRQALMACLAATLTVEFLQWRTIPGRDATIGDVLANTAGAWLGIVLATSWRRVIFPSAKPARQLGLAALVTWIAIVALGAFGVRPAPTEETFFAQRTPRLAHLAIFRGRLLEARIDGRETPSGPIPDSARVPDLMHTGLTVGARVVLRGETPGPAPIVSVFDRRRREILLLGQEGGDAIFRARLRSEPLGLRSPGVRLRRPLAQSPSADAAGADTAALRGVVDDRRLAVEVEREARSTRAELPLTAGLGWTFILPTEVALDTGAAWANALWLAALIAPAGWWLGLSMTSPRATARAGLVTLATIAATLLFIPQVLGAAPSTWWEWSGSVVGATLAWALGRRARARPGDERR